MGIVIKDYQIIQKLGEDEYLLLHPETVAENVIVSIEGITANNVDGAVKELKTLLDNKAGKDEIPDVSAFITKAVSDLVNYYTKTSVDETVADLENKISSIPKFAISVVATLPNTDISETTLYLLKTGDESNNLYTEYIYVNGSWETLGTQTLDLTGYATESWVSTKIADFVTETKVSELINNALKDYVKTADLAAMSIGKAGEADKLSSARKIALSGDVVGETTFDGSEDKTITVALANTGVTAGTYSVVAVDEKGRITAGGQVIEIGKAGQSIPSDTLAVGGLFLKQI